VTPESARADVKVEDPASRPVRPSRAPLGVRERLLAAHDQQLGRLLAVPARDAGRRRLLPRGGRAQAVDDLHRLLEVARGQDDAELVAVEARERVDLAQLTVPEGGGLLDQPVPPLAWSIAKAPSSSRSSTATETGDSERRARASSRGSSSSTRGA
jgi:hypothetical protein